VRNGSEQVVRGLSPPEPERISGAWPFRTPQRLAVLSASGMEAGRPWEAWRALAERLREDWIERDLGESDGTGRWPGWQPTEEFRRSLERAFRLHQSEGRAYGLHAYRFAADSAALGDLCELLPGSLRDGDLLCRPSPRLVLLLTAASPPAFFRVNQRVLVLWEHCWRTHADEAVEHRLEINSVELRSNDHALEFLARAAEWLEPEN